MLEKLIYLYGEEKGKEAGKKLEKIIDEAKSKIDCEDRPIWDEKDVFLITYADSFQEESIPTLTTLKKFLDLHLKGAIDGVHILPFNPYSSDRGFSVIDYYKVKKEFGDWNDVEKIGKSYRLMADLVLNHVSVKHSWFQKFLAGDQKYENYFIWFKKGEIPQEALKKVFRPRSTPLLTPFATAGGEKWVWTTFSVGNTTDQVDLNYKNPEVLMETVKILVEYFIKGVRVFRLDAVAYIWKEIGTTCKHLPQAHTIVSLLRSVIDEVCPTAIIITETNVPHGENITYFGDGVNEAQMVYNFSLPSLTLDAFYSGDASKLSSWAKVLQYPSNRCTFFNFLDTHDGIGIMGAKEILTDSQIQRIFDTIEDYGGRLSFRSAADGSKTVYEMNSTWWSALNKENAESLDLQVRKFITSRAIPMAIRGVPAIYYLSLYGAANDLKLYQKTKIKRDINRTNFEFRQLKTRLADEKSKEYKVFTAMTKLINRRKSFATFHPNVKQEVLSLDERVFALLRGEKENQILALHNVSDAKVEVKYAGRTFALEPYSFIWEEL